MNKGLYDTKTENQVIGSLSADMSLFHEDFCTLTPSDFGLERNQIVFKLLSNVAHQGVERLTFMEIETELQKYPESYAKFNDSEGLRVLLSGDFSGDRALFKNNVLRIKRFSLLRDFDAIGINISDFYSQDLFGNSSEELESYQLEDIVNKIKEKITTVEDRHLTRNVKTSQKASEGIRDLVEKYKLTPEVGEHLDGEIYNYAVRGARYGKFYLNSAPTGAGKTRTMVGNACALAYPKLDITGKKLLVKENYYPVLYIATEQEPEEIQTLILSYISGVNEESILLGSYTDDEADKVEIAIQVMELYENNFHIEWIPDPTIGIIKTKVAKYVYKEQIHFVFYDYIFSSPGLLGEFRDIKIREDVALMMMSNTLKELAVEYKVFIQSGTQITGDIDQKAMVRNQGMLRGSKAIADKVDVGTITVRICEEELDKVASIIETHGYELPNIVTDIYKCRRGKLNVVKIFRVLDYGTCQIRDLFVTDTRYKQLTDYKVLEQKIEPLTLEELEERHDKL